MTRLRRVFAAAALLSLLLAALPTPAAARPWTTGLEDAGLHLQWRVVTWVIKHWNHAKGVTNATAAEGGRINP
jgi:hypothetical protein